MVQMITGLNGDHFPVYTIYTNIKSLCHTPETNIMLYVNYTQFFKKTGKNLKCIFLSQRCQFESQHNV